MWVLLSLIVLYLFINVLLLAAGVGLGYLLRWLMPAVDLGAAILIGIVSTAISTYFFVRVISARVTESGGEDEPGTEDEGPILVYPMPPMPGRRPRRRKR